MAAETFAVRLARLRKECKLSQAQLAQHSGVGQSMVSMLEAGQRKGDYVRGGLLLPIARALGVSVEYLLEGQKPRRLSRTPGMHQIPDIGVDAP